jgi:hypothetical protein
MSNSPFKTGPLPSIPGRNPFLARPHVNERPTPPLIHAFVHRYCATDTQDICKMTRTTYPCCDSRECGWNGPTLHKARTKPNESTCRQTLRNLHMDHALLHGHPHGYVLTTCRFAASHASLIQGHPSIKDTDGC